MSILAKYFPKACEQVVVVPLAHPLCGDMHVPADKSIVQRAFLLASAADGKSHIRAVLGGDDVLAAMRACEALGAKVQQQGLDHYVVHGCDWRGNLSCQAIDCGESATLMRLLLGFAAGRSCAAQLTGHPALLARPMQRILVPLRQMGAAVWQCPERGMVHINPAPIHGMDHVLSVPSAQLKSAILLAGLGAKSATSVDDACGTRDHTERLLKHMGVDVRRQGDRVVIHPQPLLSPFGVRIAGDFSSAAFWIVAACVVPGSRVLLRSVHVNPSRLGLLWVLRQMGAEIEVRPQTVVGYHEPVADIMVTAASLQGMTVPSDRVVATIDELPILAVVAALASGTTVIRGAAELRVKESDRITAMADGLQALGVKVQACNDGWVITGGTIQGGEVDACGDHRVAMAFAVAALVASAPVRILHAGVVAKSYPGFFDCLAKYATLHTSLV